MFVGIRPFDEHARRSCFEFRMGIEGESAATAARNATRADLARMRGAIARLEDESRHGQPGLDEDFAFHIAVAEASGNDYFVSVLNALKTTIYAGMVLARTATGLSVGRKLAAINDQHRLVYEAIADGDEDTARFHMRGHLTRCKQSTQHWDATGARLEPHPPQA